MAKHASAGRISVDLSAGTGQFVVDMERANRKLNEFAGHTAHAVSGTQAASAALRTLEGNVTNNIRAAENFIAKTLNLGGALKAAFPVVGAIALGGVITELVSKAVELAEGFKKIQEAPTRIAESFSAITQPIRIANDELAVTGDRLRNEIAKLENKPQNTLRLALDEARLAADKLAESLHKDLTEVQKLLEQESVGMFKALFTGTAPTSGLVDQWKEFEAKITAINVEYNEKILATNDPKKQTALLEARTQALRQAAESEANVLRGQLATAEDLQKRRQALEAPGGQGKVIGVISGVPIQERGAPVPPSQENTIITLRKQLENLDAVLANMSFTEANAGLESLKDKLTAAKEAAKPAEAVAKALAELRAKLQGATAEQRVAGTDPFTEAIAKGSAAAVEKVAALEENLQKLGPQARLAAIADITGLETSIALTEAHTKATGDLTTKQRELQNAADNLDRELRVSADARAQELGRMQEQIDAAKAVAAAQLEGSEAVWNAQEKIKLAKIADPATQAKQRALDEQEHANAIGATVHQLDLERDATDRLNQAALGGTEARRQAELENIRQSGEAPDVIQARIRAQEARNRLEDAVSMKNMPASAGIRAYFQEMVDQAQSAAKQMHDVFANAFESLNDNLAKVLTGQKANWQSFFRSIGEQMVKNQLKDLEVTLATQIGGAIKKAGQGGGVWTEKIPGVGGVLGKLGGALGVSTGKADGSSEATALWVRMAGAGTGVPGSAIQNLFGRGDEDSDGGNGGLGSALLSMFTPRAAGGMVSPGSAYLVGENGPELFSPGARGNITANHHLGGATTVLNIDARGTDPLLVEQRVRQAMGLTHSSAVKTSFIAVQEHRMRTPQG